MSFKPDIYAAAAIGELSARFTRVRAGVDIGFGDAAVSQLLRTSCPGVWMTVEDGPVARSRVAESLDPKTVLQLGTGGEMPFDDHQFEVVVLSETSAMVEVRRVRTHDDGLRAPQELAQPYGADRGEVDAGVACDAFGA